jgi:hypothetical protein
LMLVERPLKNKHSANANTQNQASLPKCFTRTGPSSGILVCSRWRNKSDGD